MSPNKEKRRGANTSTIGGSKPKVAFASEKIARDNIRAKLEFLASQILALEQGAAASSDLPKTVRQFNQWTPEVAGGEKLGKNAQITLKKYPDLLDTLSKVLSTIETLTRFKAKSETRTERVASARRAQQMHWTLRTIAERALVGARRDLAKLRDELIIMRCRLESSEDESRRQIIALKEEVEALRAENRKLQSASSRVVPIKAKL